ncbi:MAG: sugar transporter permease [Glaciihabitans sp.]|nr:sugar transporter permease [Glaciihabitans sp.]MCU1533655.1 sugar transporter permease [Glaciihabitans sp.]MDQ1555713.1 N,N-diacetylchitobiose transport system permease protein [Actinomycetota bacterium]
MTAETTIQGAALSIAPSGQPRRRRRSITPYLLLVPATGILVLAMGYPLVWQVITSMQQFGLAQQFGQPAPFVGFANYITLATDPYMWTVIARSIAFCFAAAGLTMLIGVLVALLMQVAPRGVRIALQISLLLAWAMPVVAAMTVWNWLFNWRSGVVNWLLTRLGLPFDGHNWLQDPLSFYAVAVIIVVWMSVPFVAFSIYAGLTQVPDEVLEAAQMDGARGAQRFWNIVVPIIRPVLAIVLLLQVIWDLRVFTQIKLLQDAGSIASETNLLGTYIYQLGTGSSNFGLASAVSIFVLILTIVISAAYVRSMLKADES